MAFSEGLKGAVKPYFLTLPPFAGSNHPRVKSNFKFGEFKLP